MTKSHFPVWRVRGWCVHQIIGSTDPTLSFQWRSRSWLALMQASFSTRWLAQTQTIASKICAVGINDLPGILSHETCQLVPTRVYELPNHIRELFIDLPQVLVYMCALCEHAMQASNPHHVGWIIEVVEDYFANGDGMMTMKAPQ